MVRAGVSVIARLGQTRQDPDVVAAKKTRMAQQPQASEAAQVGQRTQRLQRQVTLQPPRSALPSGQPTTPRSRHAGRAAGKAGKHTILQQRAAGRSRCQACALSWDGRTLAGDVWLECLEAPPPTAI